MVKIALAGGSGSKSQVPLLQPISIIHVLSDVASEVIDALVATGKHDILILTRNVSLLGSTFQPW